MRNSRSTRGRNKRNSRQSWAIPVLLTAAILGLVFLWPKADTPTQASDMQLWDVRSVDTMKTSRDKARDRLNDSSYDASINKQLAAIKSLGANYVALGTPYDDEFLPYLSRWVTLARRNGLNVWFRGNFSGWEGWFDYPRDMTPSEHLVATESFIADNASLFEDGDIFDPCPECENAEHWPQPEANSQFNEFLREQQKVTEQAFNGIGKDVHSNVFSVIGGRAREVMTPGTAAALGGVVTIDHYIKDPGNMGEYVEYFASDLGARTLVGEYGAPIRDINGDMTESDQARHVEAVFGELYKHRRNVYGINYYVLSEGTTSLLNQDGSEREAAQVVRKYFTPAVITGTVKNTLGEPVEGVRIATEDGYSKAQTDGRGFYALPVPAETVQITFESGTHVPIVEMIEISKGGTVTQNAIMDPYKKNFLYKLRLFLTGK